jgi:cytidylate kinase
LAPESSVFIRHFQILAERIRTVIVTIDGPAGSGKSTTAQGVAEELNYVYLDTGAMYRAVALGFLRVNAEASQAGAKEVLSDTEVDVQYQNDQMHVFLNGEDVTGNIRTPEVGAVVSDISTLRVVRKRMVREQRRIGFEQEEAHGGVVLDGRDTGTVVFPDAPVKIYMEADLSERARRRQDEYASEGEEVTLAEVRNELKRRDRQDRNREIAPLRRSEDAITLDSTDRTIENQIAFVVDCVKEAQKSGT